MKQRSLRYRKDGAPVALRTFQAFDEIVEKLNIVAARRTPMMVRLKYEAAGELMWGLGQHRSVLCFYPAPENGKGKRMVSVGEDPAEGVLYWEYLERREGYARRRTVRADRARAAARHFFETGELSPAIRWEEF